MTLREFYEVTGGDYGDVMGRFVTEERVLRFVRKFPADGSFAALKSSLADGNAQEAFRAAHTVKGVAQNLGFTAEVVTNILRGGSLAVDERMPELERLYNLTVESIAALD